LIIVLEWRYAKFDLSRLKIFSKGHG